MTACFTATPGVDVITTTADIPALGSIAINAFVLHGPEPVLVDTGTVAGAPEFMTALASVIDPAELRWIWLTHTDFDHIGSLAALLEANPWLRVITSSAMARISSMVSWRRRARRSAGAGMDSAVVDAIPTNNSRSCG